MSGDLVELIYDAALVADLWPSVLAGIAEACGAVSATLVPAQDLAGLVISPDAAESHAAYVEHWWRHDVIAAAIFSSRRYGIFCDWLLIPPSTRARHPFYQEFRRSFGLRDNLTAAVGSEHELRFGLSLQLPLSAADPPDADVVDRFTRLARHVSRAMLFAQKLNRQEPQASVLTGLLGALTCGAACLDGTGRVLLANPALLSLAGDGLDVLRDRLVTSRPADQAPLDALIRRAGSAPASLGPDVVPLHRPNGRRPLLAGGLPLSAERQESLFGGELPGCRVLVTVTDPEAQVPARTEASLRALALSGAEARVAALVGQGLAPRDVAERLALTEGTVRTTLKQVFGKLGVSRQGELVRLVTQLSLLNGP